MRILTVLVLLLSGCDEAVPLPDHADLSAADLALLKEGALCYDGLAAIGPCASGLKCCIPHCPYRGDGGNEQLCEDPLAYCAPVTASSPPPGFDSCFDHY
jgi:hypothetical protein